MQRSLAKRIWYGLVSVVSRLIAVIVFRIHCSGRENIPTTGGGLVCANHQSFLDPLLIGLPRRPAALTTSVFLPRRLALTRGGPPPIDLASLT